MGRDFSRGAIFRGPLAAKLAENKSARRPGPQQQQRGPQLGPGIAMERMCDTGVVNPNTTVKVEYKDCLSH